MNTFGWASMGVSCLLVFLAGCGGAVDGGGESEVQDPLAISNPLDSVVLPRYPLLEYNGNIKITLDGPVDLQPAPDRNTHVNRHLFHTTSGAVIETRLRNRYKPIPNEFCPGDMQDNWVDTDGGSSDCPTCIIGFAQDVQLAPLSFGAKNLLTGYAGRFSIQLVRNDETSLEQVPPDATLSSTFPQSEVVASVERAGLVGGGLTLFQYDPQKTVRVWSFPFIAGLPLGSCFVRVNKHDRPIYQEDGYALTVDTLNQVTETLETNNTAQLLN